MDTIQQIRKYVEARGGKDTLAEEGKNALADMAKKDGKRKGSAVNLRPTANDSNAETG